MMRQTTFMLDALDERAFDGYTRSENWNGFDCPYFDFDQAQVLLAAWREHGWAARYEDHADAFIFSMNQDLETGESSEDGTFPSIQIDGHTLYAIGAFC
jgi:hypothetical protein